MAGYAWSISGNATFADGSTTASGTPVLVTAGLGTPGHDSFTLSLTVTNANGCTATCPKTVDIGPAPAGCTVSGPGPVCAGATYTYTINEDPVPGVTFQFA